MGTMQKTNKQTNTVVLDSLKNLYLLHLRPEVSTVEVEGLARWLNSPEWRFLGYHDNRPLPVAPSQSADDSTQQCVLMRAGSGALVRFLNVA